MVEGTFNAQRSTFKCEPPVVVALAPPPERFGAQEARRRGARVCNPPAALAAASEYSCGGPLAFGKIC